MGFGAFLGYRSGKGCAGRAALVRVLLHAQAVEGRSFLRRGAGGVRATDLAVKGLCPKAQTEDMSSARLGMDDRPQGAPQCLSRSKQKLLKASKSVSTRNCVNPPDSSGWSCRSLGMRPALDLTRTMRLRCGPFRHLELSCTILEEYQNKKRKSIHLIEFDGHNKNEWI